MAQPMRVPGPAAVAEAQPRGSASLLRNVRLRRYPNLSECVDDGPPDAPCQHTECRYHLAHRGYWEHVTRPTWDCSIDIANAGPHTLDEVAVFLGVSGERVRQIEEQALALLKHNATMKGLHDESPK